jgi:hypothetical protein
MKLFKSFLILCVAMTGSAVAQPSESWSVTVVQGTSKGGSAAPVKLKRQPFQLVFSGPKTMGYAILAAPTCADLNALKTEAEISQVISPANVVLEGKVDENVFLSVNLGEVRAAAIVASHVWGEDSDNEIHSFQSVKPSGSTDHVVTRNIKEVSMVDAKGAPQSIPLTKYPQPEICILATGLPPVGYMAHVQPKWIRVQFR